MFLPLPKLEKEMGHYSMKKLNVLLTFVCGLAITPNSAVGLSFDDIYYTTDNPLIGGGYFGGDGDIGSGSNDWIDWSVGNSQPWSGPSTDDMVFSTCVGDFLNPNDWRERMRITKEGNVGIGTSNPTARLEIDFEETGSLKGGTPLGNGPGWIFMAPNGHRRDITGWVGGLYFGASSTGDAANPTMTVNENGNVGIGTTDPTGKLDIDFGDTGSVNAGTPLGNGPGWIFYAPNGHRRDITAWINGFYIGASSDDGAANPTLTVNENGTVGIGTTNPQGTLDVNGPIFQRGSQIHADYVFEPSYSIESIEEHASFMWNDKHLKAVPKARKDENGMDIVEYGAHIRGMLEELEKAHVYIANLNELVKEQQKTIAVLSEKVHSLEN